MFPHAHTCTFMSHSAANDWKTLLMSVIDEVVQNSASGMGEQGSSPGLVKPETLNMLSNFRYCSQEIRSELFAKTLIFPLKELKTPAAYLLYLRKGLTKTKKGRIPTVAHPRLTWSFIWSPCCVVICAVPRENKHYGLCVMYIFRSACAG